MLLTVIAKLEEARLALALFRSMAEGGEQISDTADEIFRRAMENATPTSSRV